MASRCSQDDTRLAEIAAVIPRMFPKPSRRAVFNEITKKAVIHGIENPRQIEPLLVDAYMARRALDYLVGFNISPILWTKLPGSKSAGRVQSVDPMGGRASRDRRTGETFTGGQS